VSTAAVALPLAIAAILYLPSPAFFLFALAIVEIAVFEFCRLTAGWAPSAPRRALLVLAPLFAWLLSPELLPAGGPGTPELALAAAALVAVGAGSLALLARTAVAESIAALGVLAFGTVYFGLPVAAIYWVHRRDPWLLLLLVAIVWLGDSAAYLCGRSWGRRRLAPVISPRKTWEGAAGGLVVALLAAAAWSAWRLGGVPLGLLALAGATSVFAQLGDLVESMIKRGAGIKDSGDLLPGHGGMLDRMDALLFAAPVFVLGVWLLGIDGLSG